MAKIDWIQAGEYVVGEGSATGLSDVLNRPVKTLLAISGDDDTGQNVKGYAKIGHTHDAADISGNINAATLGGLTSADFARVTHNHTWGDITDTPTTITGYGITDAYTKTEVDTGLAGKADINHEHNAADITSGVMATARLGAGTADNTKFLRGDQTWATPAGGGGSGILPYPYQPPAVASAYDDEFDSNILNAKWTTLNDVTAPNTSDINTTVPSWLIANFKNSTAESIEIEQTIGAEGIAGTAFSATIRCANAGQSDNEAVFLHLKDAEPSANEVATGLQFFTEFKIEFFKQVAGVNTFDLGKKTALLSSIFLHLQRDAANSWSMYWSYDGVGWFKNSVTFVLAFNITKLSLAIAGTSANKRLGVDWVRVNWLTL